MLGLHCPRCAGPLALEPFADAAGGAELRCLLCGHQARRFGRAEWEYWRLHGRLPTRAELYGDPTPAEPSPRRGRPLGSEGRYGPEARAELARLHAEGRSQPDIAAHLGWSREGVGRALRRIGAAGRQPCGP